MRPNILENLGNVNLFNIVIHTIITRSIINTITSFHRYQQQQQLEEGRERCFRDVIRTGERC